MWLYLRVGKMIQILVNELLWALLLTILIEAVVILPLFRKYSDSFKRLCINFILVNAITNLTLNLFILFFSLNVVMILVMELLIPLIEAFMYKVGHVKATWKRLTVVCYLSNVLSFTLGLLWNYVWR